MSAEGEVRIPYTEATRLIAAEAGREAAKEVLQWHADSCPARQYFPRLQEDVAAITGSVKTLGDSIKGVVRLRKRIYVAAGTVAAGVLYAIGQGIYVYVTHVAGKG